MDKNTKGRRAMMDGIPGIPAADVRARIDELTHERVLNLLKSIEHITTSEGEPCPYCGMSRGYGHDDGKPFGEPCELKAVIDLLEANE